jgi:hypothetical protein
VRSETRETTVPLAITTVDRTANTIEGTSEPGAVVVVFIEPDAGPLAGQFTMFRSVAGPEGHWRVETSDAVDLRD